MIIFLAGMLDVPRQLYEAADIEGASGWQKFRSVTLPLISPVIFFSFVIGVIYGFQYFTQPYVISFWLTGDAAQIGHPQNSLLFFTSRLYQMGFQNFKMGYASALAWVLLDRHDGLHPRDPEELEALGALRRWAPIAAPTVSVDRSPVVGRARRRGASARAARRASPPVPGVGREPLAADRGRRDVHAAVRVRGPHLAHDDRPGPDDRPVALTVPVVQLLRGVRTGSRCSATRSTR